MSSLAHILDVLHLLCSNLTCPILHLRVSTLTIQMLLIPLGGAAGILWDSVGSASRVMNAHQTPKIQQLIWIYTIIK